MKTYKQLTEAQRYQIAALKEVRILNKDIAVIVGTSKSTITREFQRNTGKRGYRPKQAQNKASIRKKESAKAIKMTVETIALIEKQIRFDLSPEQVSGWLKKAHGIRVSHERIYQHIWADKRDSGHLHSHLRQKQARGGVNTHQRINGDRFQTTSALRSVLKLLKKKHGWVTGRLIQ